MIALFFYYSSSSLIFPINLNILSVGLCRTQYFQEGIPGILVETPVLMLLFFWQLTIKEITPFHDELSNLFIS